MESLPFITSTDSPSVIQKRLRDIYHAVLKALENFASLPIKNSTYFGNLLWINYINPSTTYHAIRVGHSIHIGRNGSMKNMVLQNVGGVFVLQDSLSGKTLSAEQIPGIILRFSREILGHEKRPKIVTYTCPMRIKREVVDHF